MSVDAEPERPLSTDDGEPKPDDAPLLRRFERHVGRRVASGFIVLVPALVSLWFIFFVFRFLDGLFRSEHGMLRLLVRDRPWDFWGLGVVLTVAILYVIGAFFSGKRYQSLQDAVLSRIPVVRSIYGVARLATEALSSPLGHHFSRVVFVEWPRPGVGSMGLVTGHLRSTRRGEEPLVAGYIPTVPNPTSGMLAFFREEDVAETNITVEDAMKTVFSGGIVLPKMAARVIRSDYKPLKKASEGQESEPAAVHRTT